MGYMATPTNAAPSEVLVRFARRVSHDVNNFSTVVSTYSELLLADLPPESPAHADVQEIHAAAEQLVHYLHRVTRFARAASMRRAPVAVAAGITDAVSVMREKHPARTMLVSEVPAVQIEADAGWWRDMLGELLVNADEWAPDGTSIVVQAAVEDGHVVVQIRDEGPGPSADVLPSIGEPFVSTKQGVRGAGMGLALVHAFALAAHGRFVLRRDGTHTVAELAIPVVP